MNIVETHKKAIPRGMAFLCDFGGWLYCLTSSLFPEVTF